MLGENFCLMQFSAYNFVAHFFSFSAEINSFNSSELPKFSTSQSLLHMNSFKGLISSNN